MEMKINQSGLIFNSYLRLALRSPNKR